MEIIKWLHELISVLSMHRGIYITLQQVLNLYPDERDSELDDVVIAMFGFFIFYIK